MNKGQMNLQDLFLNQVRKDNIAVTIYLVGGVQLKGMVRGFDAFTVILESMGKPPQLVYKHAIASVVPSRSVGPLYRDTPDDVPAAEKPRQQAAEPQQQEE